MKIIHIGLLTYYTEGMTYQENILPLINARDGHEVVFVANAFKYENGSIVETEEEDRYLEDGFRLIRYKYDRLLTTLISNKVQKVRRIKGLLNDFKPDAIMFHGVCGYELLDVAEYVAHNPEVLFYIDCHEDFGNTARNPISYIFYKYIQGLFVNRAVPYAKKVLYVGEDSKIYLKKMYHIDDDKLEFYPLGGIVTTEREQLECREQLLEEFRLPSDSIILMHSGKMDVLKRTDVLLEAFSEVDKNNMFLFVFGSIPKENEEILKSLIESNDRVFFLGWKSGDEIIKLLNAADVYCQPGSPSATSQVALCCGCAEIVCPILSYRVMYEDDVLYAYEKDEIKRQLELLSEKEYLESYKRKGYNMAKSILDYRKLANRYLE